MEELKKAPVTVLLILANILVFTAVEFTGAGSTEGAECQWHTFSTDRNNYPKKVSNPMLTLALSACR